MPTDATTIEIPVEGGAIPTQVMSPDDSQRWPALVCVPSIFGPAPDLIASLSTLADRALVAVPDPFWRIGGGVVPYDDHATARGRLADFDLKACFRDLQSVIEWVAGRSNGKVVGLGICFGGPFVLSFAARKRLAGVVTWHGSRMEQYLDQADEITCPLRLHFGEADPITPPAAIERIRSAFATHPDVSIVVFPGLVHGYSHGGDAHDPTASRAGLEAARSLLASLE